MNCSFDTLVVGAGLAGACAAAELARHERVLLVDASHPAAGASGVGAGLASPLMGLRSRPPWRVREALPALDRLIDAADFRPHVRSGLLRSAMTPQQAEDCRKSAEEFPDMARWHAEPLTGETTDPTDTKGWSFVRAPFGLLDIYGGMTLSIPEFVDAVVRLAVRRGAVTRFPARLRRWHASAGADACVTAHFADGAPVVARRMLLALGGGMLPPWCGELMRGQLPRLHLHAVKGQSVRVARPAGLPPATDAAAMLPSLSGAGYIVDEGDTFFVGSTYEHTFSHMEPDVDMGDALLDRAITMMPSLAGSPVVERLAGCRATVPGIRLPMVGPLPGTPGVHVFTGLGSKGLILAPLLAEEIPHYFRHPEAIPEEIRVAVRPRNR
ncbi:MAG: FAD-binding oxidoreductase [Rhodothermales bacterium]